MSSALVLIFALSSLLCDSVVQARLGQEDRKLEELRRHRKLVSAEAGKHVKGQYIIGFEPLLVEDVQAQVKALTDEDDDDDADRKVMYTFDTVMKGCAMKDVSVNMLEKLLRDPNVKYIEEVSLIFVGKTDFAYFAESAYSHSVRCLHRIRLLKHTLNKTMLRGDLITSMEKTTESTNMNTTEKEWRYTL